MRLLVASALALFAVVSTLTAETACSSSSTPGSSGGSSSGSTSSRTAIDCTDLIAQLSPAANSFVSGSWGDIPSDLQQLPSDGKLCGTIVIGDGGAISDQEIVITTALDGTDLTDFYAPLFAKKSCTAQSSTLAGTIAYKCPNSQLANILPSGNEQYILFSFGDI